ncbi:glycosyltransferase family 9 protein [Telluria mixta]|uniref:Glycosyltransferase family 9 protein n=1 Tax=Telluria mixta TaxID=34071 RepID=A0ABT2C8X1_9BURK|nr:glycosyltransferase family 9 protein [Telluria mixta]MCS0633860.1 glycosyltransferase family 9 protein [Telluria mixta]WEM93221.1 glycosyltransferase family 9 protein [Telluria mixta]
MTATWLQARRILCVRLDSLGDVLMCTPAMRALRQAVPGRTLTLLSSPSGAAALPFIPELDDAIAWSAPWTKSATPATASATAPAPLATLAARAFDAAVIFTTYTQSALPAALLCQLAGIPLRLAHCRENPYDLLTDWVPEPEPATLVRHEVQRQLALVQRVGCRSADLGLSFVPRPADFTAARARLTAAGIDPDRPWILLHPGASAASRRYPAGHWAHVLRLLAQELQLPLVLTGSAEECELVDGIQFASAVPAVSLAGRLALGELGAALRLAAIVVTNNTGPAHMAAAVGTPVVDLYALTNPQHTPWNVRSRVLFHDVPCRFCYRSTCPEGHQACLDGVAPQRVVEAVRELLGATQAAPAAVPT